MGGHSEGALGAAVLPDGRTRFLVWAPHAREAEVHLVAPVEERARLEPRDLGYHEGTIEDAGPGCLYYYRLDDGPDRPDPASRSQPDGVHGPSQVVSQDFPWEDTGWQGLSLEDYILYELHVGTFTNEGTFDAIIPVLGELAELGITAIELMPVAQFPGERNWGYDGVCPFAVQNSYGGVEGLKRLVNACHRQGLAVVLDVVYNHAGPEGNYLEEFGPYFTDGYRTVWGLALNFDGRQSDEVRRFFIENALYWVTECHIDALRLDAVDWIVDRSASTFVEELTGAVHRRAEELGRRACLIGESALNDPRLVRPPELGGYGLDAQWNDEFHHALYALLTGERSGYYQDYGELKHLAKAFAEGFVYTGQYSAFRRRRYGKSSREVPPSELVIFGQNHDQIGNRLHGRRLNQLVSFEAVKLAAGAVLLSPYVPLLFMGEEYGETAPFEYFVSHSEPALIAAVRHGRAEQYAFFGWEGEPPDPQDEATFMRCKLDRDLQTGGAHEVLLRFHKELIRLRKTCPALAYISRAQMEVVAFDEAQTLFIRRWSDEDETGIALNFGEGEISVGLPLPAGCWRRLLDSAEERWQGPGAGAPEKLESKGDVELTLRPHSFALFARERPP